MPSPPAVGFSNFLLGEPEHMKKCVEDIGEGCTSSAT